MTDSQRLDRASLAKQAAARLRDEILSGAAPPGERLVVRDLVERWGVSHIPIREALRVLHGEGLVIIEPNRGAHVRPIYSGFIEDLFAQPVAIRLSPGARHWPIFARLCRESGAIGNLVPDAFLAALALEHGCELITNDGDFARFKGLRWRHPLA